MTAGTATAKGACLLCASPASLRCSACGSQGIDLYFCGPAHQKQAWPAHKVLCGARAHPVQVPAFSKKEADLMWRRYNQTPAVDSQAEIQNHVKLLCELGTGKDVKGTLDDLAVGATRPGARLINDEADLIVAIRAMNARWYCTIPPEHAGPPPYLEVFVTAYHHMTDLSICDNITSDPLLHSQLCHLLMVHALLYIEVDRIMLEVKIAQDNGHPLPADAALLEANYDLLRRFIREAVAQRPGWTFAGKLEANLSSWLNNLGEPVLRKALGAQMQ